MKFSILMANYNNADYIANAIDSVINQTYSNWEIIIVDDKSEDNSLSVIKPYMKNSKIKLYKNTTNMGCGYTKKRCIDLSTGDIIGFLDPDDSITKEAIQIMIEHHKVLPDHSIIYSNHYLCDDKLNVIRKADYVGPIPKGESQATYIGPKISAFASFKRTKYLLTEGLNPYLKRAVDQDLYHKLEETGESYFIDLTLYYYRNNSNSISLNQNNIKALYWNLLVLEDTYKRRSNKKYINISKKIKKSEFNNAFFQYFILKASQKASKHEWTKMYYCIYKVIPLFFLDKNLMILKLMFFSIKNAIKSISYGRN